MIYFPQNNIKGVFLSETLICNANNVFCGYIVVWKAITYVLPPCSCRVPVVWPILA